MTGEKYGRKKKEKTITSKSFGKAPESRQKSWEERALNFHYELYQIVVLYN